jgi:hypothetical protein
MMAARQQMATLPKHSNVPHGDVRNFSDAEIRIATERVLDGEAFRRSLRLQRFLRFITDLTLSGQESSINEYLIGVEVFERGPGYDQSDDSVVRRQAHALRQKLGEYYNSEGRDDPIQIEVPLGHYVPVFKANPRLDAKPSRLPVDSPAPVVPPLPDVVRPKIGIATALAAIAVAALLSFWIGRSTTPATSAAAVPGAAIDRNVREFWGQWFAAEQGPMIVFSSPPTGILKFFETPVPADSQPPRSEIGGVIEDQFREFFELPPGGHLYISPSVTETKSGESLAAVRLANVFAGGGLHARATLSRLLTWDDFRRENLILLGHNEQNQWMDPLLSKYPLRLEATDGAQQRRIINTEPADDEQPFYQIDYASSDIEPTVEYALVSMLPGTDDRHQLLLISGLNTQATLMAAEFLTDPRRVTSLHSRLEKASPNHSGPWRFQALLSADVRDKVPTGGAIELVRVLD